MQINPGNVFGISTNTGFSKFSEKYILREQVHAGVKLYFRPVKENINLNILMKFALNSGVQFWNQNLQNWEIHTFLCQ